MSAGYCRPLALVELRDLGEGGFSRLLPSVLRRPTFWL